MRGESGRITVEVYMPQSCDTAMYIALYVKVLVSYPTKVSVSSPFQQLIIALSNRVAHQLSHQVCCKWVSAPIQQCKGATLVADGAVKRRISGLMSDEAHAGSSVRGDKSGRGMEADRDWIPQACVTVR